jgi:hypothetical protein
MTTTTQPVLSVEVSPYLISTTGRHVTKTVTVTDRGSSPLAVTAGFRALERVNGQCRAAQAPKWVTASPASYKLAPGQSRHVTLTINAPAAVTGHYDILAVQSALPANTAHAAMGDTIGGGVGVRMLIDYGGPTTGKPCATAAAQPRAAAPPASGFPLAGALGGLAVVLVALLAVWAVMLRRRHARR